MDKIDCVPTMYQHWVKCLTWSNNSQNNLCCRYYFPHFAEEELRRREVRSLPKDKKLVMEEAGNQSGQPES